MDSAVVVPGFESTGSIIVAQGLSSLRHVGSSWTRDWTHVSSFGRQIPYHWATREPFYVVLTQSSCPFFSQKESSVVCEGPPVGRSKGVKIITCLVTLSPPLWESLGHVWLCNSMRLYSPWNSLGQNTEVDSLSLLQGIFLTKRLKPALPHCRWILYQLSHRGSLLCGWNVKFRLDRPFPRKFPRGLGGTRWLPWETENGETNFNYLGLIWALS